jgi:hypothetical protein
MFALSLVTSNEKGKGTDQVSGDAVLHRQRKRLYLALPRSTSLWDGSRLGVLERMNRCSAGNMQSNFYSCVVQQVSWHDCLSPFATNLGLTGTRDQWVAVEIWEGGHQCTSPTWADLLAAGDSQPTWKVHKQHTMSKKEALPVAEMFLPHGATLLRKPTSKTKSVSTANETILHFLLLLSAKLSDAPPSDVWAEDQDESENRMSLSIYTPSHSDMSASDPGTPNSGSEKMSSSNTAVSTPLGSPGMIQSAPNSGLSPKDVTLPIPGWPALARRVANTPDFQAFPSFTDLNIKSLLYYQAQLILLRKKLHKVEFKDYYNSNDEDLPSRFAEDLQYLIEGKGNPEQWDLIEQIRTVLDRYSKSRWAVLRIQM